MTQCGLCETGAVDPSFVVRGVQSSIVCPRCILDGVKTVAKEEATAAPDLLDALCSKDGKYLFCEAKAMTEGPLVDGMCHCGRGKPTGNAVAAGIYVTVCCDACVLEGARMVTKTTATGRCGVALLPRIKFAEVENPHNPKVDPKAEVPIAEDPKAEDPRVDKFPPMKLYIEAEVRALERIRSAKPRKVTFVKDKKKLPFDVESLDRDLRHAIVGDYLRSEKPITSYSMAVKNFKAASHVNDVMRAAHELAGCDIHIKKPAVLHAIAKLMNGNEINVEECAKKVVDMDKNGPKLFVPVYF